MTRVALLSDINRQLADFGQSRSFCPILFSSGYLLIRVVLDYATRGCISSSLVTYILVRTYLDIRWILSLNLESDYIKSYLSKDKCFDVHYIFTNLHEVL